MLSRKLIRLVLGIAMLGIIATGAASASTVVGSGTIASVTWSPSPPPNPINIGYPGNTINLNAPGLLQINGYTVGKDGLPTIKTPTEATFLGMLQPPLDIQYNGDARVIAAGTQWQLTLSFPAYSGYSATLGINGPLTISP